MKDTTYNEYLLALLSNMREHNAFYDELKVNTYLSLLTFNNDNYQQSFFTDEVNMLEDFLRKVNNLKVKLQLHRKLTEIETLLENIKSIYNDNKHTIEKYNKGSVNIDMILSSQNTSELTKLVDSLTKEKMQRVSHKEETQNLRNLISNNILNNSYEIQNGTIYLDIPSQDKISISLDKFFEIYEYLLNPKDYKEPFLNPNANAKQKDTIMSLINSVNELNYDSLIPITLTYLLNKNIPNYELIDTSTFKIVNIKINELYSLAGKNQSILNPNTAKWQQIKIPNEYLYQKLNEIIKKGMYYFENENLVFENIIANTSDFKVTISKENLINFLKTNLECLIATSITS